ncbi:MAG: collagen binding domain-containing protein [Ruminococcus sp.]
MTKVHKAGDLVESLTTREDGSAVSKELYLGKYKVVEQNAPENLVIGKTEQERTQFVTLSYAGQNVELSQGETVFTNARPEISVNVVKKSKHDDVTLEGATFGLYVEEDHERQQTEGPCRKRKPGGTCCFRQGKEWLCSMQIFL